MNRLKVEMASTQSMSKLLPPLKPSQPHLNAHQQHHQHHQQVSTNASNKNEPFWRRKDSIVDEKRIMKQAKEALATSIVPNCSWSESRRSTLINDGVGERADDTASLASSKGDYEDQEGTTYRSNSYQRFLDELSSPQIRLRVVDVDNMNPIEVDTDNCDPTDEKTLSELKTKVYSSVVKSYDLVIPKRIELPVINTAFKAATTRRERFSLNEAAIRSIRQRRLSDWHEESVSDEPQTKSETDNEVIPNSDTRTSNEANNETEPIKHDDSDSAKVDRTSNDTSSLVWSSTKSKNDNKSSNETSNSNSNNRRSSKSNSESDRATTSTLGTSESTHFPSFPSSSSSRKNSRNYSNLKSLSIGLFDNYTLNNDAANTNNTVRSSATDPGGLSLSYQLGLPQDKSRRTSLRRSIQATHFLVNNPIHYESNPEVRKYFCHKVRIVIALIKILEFAAQKAEVTKAFFRMAAANTDYISEIVQDSFNPSNDSDQIVFNKDFYKAKKETDVGKEMQYALTIPPEARSADQIKMVRLGLNKVDSFIEYPVYMQEKICRCAFYQKVPSKRVIIRQGQIADSFYFIISGQAMVTILEEDKNSNEVKNRIVAILKDGTCFGELAFLYNTTRTATVTSLTNMELISIGRQDFYDIFMSKRGEEPDHIRFLRSCEFTDYWPVHSLLQNPQHCLFHYYKKGQIIVKNSHECEYIYVVKSGSCQVLKRLEQVKPRRLRPIRSNHSSASSRGYFLQDVYQSKVDTGLRQSFHSNKDASIPWSFTSIDDMSNSSKNEPKPVFLQIQLLKEGDTFGLNTLKFDESDRNIPNPELSLVSNGSEVVMLRKDVFLRNADTRVRNNIRRLVQPFPESDAMQQKLQNKSDWVYFKKKVMDEVVEDMKFQRRFSAFPHMQRRSLKVK